ncbi:unnamed protein product [Lathyrus oleraceus]
MLHCWIYENFSIICDRRVQHSPMGAPQARRWRAKKSHPCGVTGYKRRLDALTVDDVIWIPYTDHRVHCDFDETSLYSGYMRWKTMVARHLPKRCL